MISEMGFDLRKSFLRLEEENRHLRWEIEQLKARVSQLESNEKLYFQGVPHLDMEEEEFEDGEWHGAAHWHNEY